MPRSILALLRLWCVGEKAVTIVVVAAIAAGPTRGGERERDMLVVRDIGTEGGGTPVPIMTAATAEETVDWIECRDLGRISVVVDVDEVEDTEGWRARTLTSMVGAVVVQDDICVSVVESVEAVVVLVAVLFAKPAVVGNKADFGEETRSLGEEVYSPGENNPCPCI
jgi:hypothetical protein